MMCEKLKLTGMMGQPFLTFLGERTKGLGQAQASKTILAV